MLFYLGTMLAVIAAGELLAGRGKGNTAKVREVWNALGFRTRDGKYPIKINKAEDHLIFQLQPGMCAEEVTLMQPYLNSHLKAETDVWAENGFVHIKVMGENLPEKMPYIDIKPPEDMILPIPIGQSREGFIWADLAQIPHVCVGGETYGGKTTWIVGALNSLAKLPHVRLYIFDLKQVDYAWIQDHSEQAITLPDSVRLLEDITLEMMRRMKLFREAVTPNLQRYNALMRKQGKEELPYLVLVIDELTQLAPILGKTKEIKAMRTAATQMLVDITSLARAIGIHCIISTQRPDRDTLHPSVKSNLPGAMAFKTKNNTNSKIILDNNKASLLPRIRGRSVWQFDKEREIQVMFLDDEQARAMLPKVPVTKPKQEEKISFDGTM